MAVGIRNVLAAVGLAVLAGAAQAGPPGAAGDIYSSDGFAGGLYQYDFATGDVVGLFASRGTRTFLQHAWGPDGDLYAITTANPSRWDLDRFDGTTGQWLGSVVQHLNDGSASVGKGFAFGPDGDIFIGDFFRAQIHRYDGTTFALEDTYSGIPGDNLGTPNYMNIGPNGSLFVVAGGFNTVLEFDISGSSSVDLIGDFASMAGASQPQDIFFTDWGTAFVSSGGGDFIREIDANTGAFIRDIQLGFDTDPLGITVDSMNRLLVATGGGTSANAFSILMYDAITGSYLGDFSTFPNGQAGFDGSPIYLTQKPIPAPGALMLAPASLLLLRRRR